MEYFDLEDPFTTLKQHQFDTISTIFSSESDHMPCLNYLQCLKTSDFHVSFRQEAMSLVFQVPPSPLSLILNYYLYFVCCKLVFNWTRHSIVVTLIHIHHTLLLLTWIDSFPNKKSL